MEIRIPCTCGQTYAFEVEPVNEMMPCPVSCPVCGVDGTAPANQTIKQKLAASTLAVAAQVPPPAIGPVSAAPGGLRINRPTHAPAPPADDPSEPAAPPPLSAPPAYTRSRGYQPEQAEKVAEPRILMGLLGGILAGGLAMVGWYFLTMATYKHYSIAAWFVGVMTGVGVRWLGKEGHPKLGFIAAVCAALAILVADFMAVNTVFSKLQGLVAQGAEEEYNSQMKLAKSAVEAKTDEQISKWLTENVDLEDKPTSADIQKFRSETQPEMQNLLEGKTTKETFMKKNSGELDKMFTFSFKWQIYKDSVSFISLIFVIFGVISAWRIATG